MTEKKGRGGVRPGAGAPKKDQLAKPRSLRMIDAHWSKLKALGGARWIVEQMEKLKD